MYAYGWIGICWNIHAHIHVIAGFSIAQTDINVRRAHLRRRPRCKRRRPRCEHRRPRRRCTGSTSEIKMADRMECEQTKAS